MEAYLQLGIEVQTEIWTEDFDPSTDTLLFKQDTIYASYLIYLNSCGDYDCDIRFDADTLLLLENNISKSQCEDGRVDRFMFTIHNPENKAYVVRRQYNPGKWLGRE